MSLLKDSIKLLVAQEALKYTQSNSVIGVGSGTTIREYLRAVKNAHESHKIIGFTAVCSSIDSEILCRTYSFSVRSPDDFDDLNIYIDGADEITIKGFALKGLGGALTREKILRSRCKKFIVIVTSDKLVEYLGERTPIPVEILPFGYTGTIKAIKRLSNNNFQIKEIQLREGKGKMGPVMTDNGNFIVDIYLTNLLPDDQKMLEKINIDLKSISGVIETGIFSNPADIIIIGEIKTGKVEIIQRKT
ncbi:MAG: ribose 5-phosphate isomerase A [Candidatus Thorarchaeota archaeon]